MRGVTQKVDPLLDPGWPEGECVRASAATILGLPLESVPRLDPLAASLRGKSQPELERDFYRSQGYNLVLIEAEPPDVIPDDVLASLPSVPHLMSGESPRGTMHRVVACGGRTIWDPHPSREGLVSVHSVGFLFPVVRE